MKIFFHRVEEQISIILDICKDEDSGKADIKSFYAVINFKSVFIKIIIIIYTEQLPIGEKKVDLQIFCEFSKKHSKINFYSFIT